MTATFPLPNFVADPAWPNSWTVGARANIDTTATGDPAARINKTSPGTAHAVLNAEVQDFAQIRDNRGMPVAPGTQYHVHLKTVTDAALNLSLVIYEFDSQDQRLTRVTVPPNEPHAFVTHPDVSRLLLSLRLKGMGHVLLHELTFLQVHTTEERPPGLHGPTEDADSSSDGEQASHDADQLVRNVRSDLRRLSSLARESLETVTAIEKSLDLLQEVLREDQKHQNAGDVMTLLVSQRQLEMEVRQYMATLAKHDTDS